jgi:N,N'-diacetyllegionaminate synthase
MVKIKIGNVMLGDNEPCFTIAEAGANHDGSLEKALKLIDAAKESNVNSIKFQTYKASKLTTKSAPKYWDDGKHEETQFDVFSKLDGLTNDNWNEIFEYAKKKDIMCFSTPFDNDSVDLLYSLDVPAFKIASADITDIPLIEFIASKQLPIFISTGMASDDEITEAVDSIKNQGNNDIIILHCITSYPTNFEDANLSMIRSLKNQFPNHVIGFSDHTLGTTAALCSTFYGSKCIEKHFTYDKKLSTSPDHRLSLDVNDFQKLISELRISEVSVGSDTRNSFNSESEAVKYARRSLVSKIKIPKESIITESMLEIKRPGTGIPPKFFSKIIGSIAKVDIDEDTTLQWDHIQQKQ